jgi:hypothetical protein
LRELLEIKCKKILKNLEREDLELSVIRADYHDGYTVRTFNRKTYMLQCIEFKMYQILKHKKFEKKMRSYARFIPIMF